jgi:hypothetical protein
VEGGVPSSVAVSKVDPPVVIVLALRAVVTPVTASGSRGAPVRAGLAGVSVADGDGDALFVGRPDRVADGDGDGLFVGRADRVADGDGDGLLGVGAGVRVGAGVGAPFTVSAVAHGWPAEHVPPWGKAAVVSFAPWAAPAATVTRNDVVA